MTAPRAHKDRKKSQPMKTTPETKTSNAAIIVILYLVILFACLRSLMAACELNHLPVAADMPPTTLQAMGAVAAREEMAVPVYRVSRYTSRETCYHRPCITASGRVAVAGVTVACPYSVPLGTWVVIDGVPYRCDDRTARWIQERRGDTFDIFAGYGMAAYSEALRFGVHRSEVSVLFNQ